MAESGNSKKGVRRGQSGVESRKEWKYSSRVEESRAAERRVTSAALNWQQATGSVGSVGSGGTSST